MKLSVLGHWPSHTNSPADPRIKLELSVRVWGIPGWGQWDLDSSCHAAAQGPKIRNCGDLSCSNPTGGGLGSKLKRQFDVNVCKCMLIAIKEEF